MAEARFEERVYTRTERPMGDRSIPTILADLLGQFTTLLRQESQLARAELSENMSRAVMGIALAGAAAVLFIPALVILLAAGVYGLAEGLGWSMWLSALVVGAAALIVGVILLLIGMSRLKAKALMPNKTITQLQEDAAMAKRQMSAEPVTETKVEGSYGYQRAA